MTTTAAITAIEYYFPDGVLTNAALAEEFPDWTVERIESKTGISARRVTSSDQCASDLAYEAARRLFTETAIPATEIDFLLFCTQSPDYLLPATACLLQERLGLSTSAGALDFNLGCSGFVYGLGLAKGLIESGQATNVLLLTADTYTKFIDPADRSVRTLFGDAAAATLIQAKQADRQLITPVLFGTDGRGARNLIVEGSGLRPPPRDTSRYLQMAGAELFAFAMEAVPKVVDELLNIHGFQRDDIDLFLFHQANRHMLQNIQRRARIPSDRFYVDFEDCGNTVSASIPIAMKRAVEKGRLHDKHRVMVVGFGVGYSWAGAILHQSLEASGRGRRNQQPFTANRVL